MHRSGTSALTGALAQMGVHVGDEEELTAKSWENPAGFFERRDARKICDTLLHESGADWWKVSSFHPDNANYETVRTQRLAIRDLVQHLDEHGVWALKEPRLCLLLPIFQSALYNPLAIIAVRHPVEIARSLRRRNGFPLQAGLALWEAYMVSLLRTGLSMDHVFVDFRELLTDPDRALEALARELRTRGLRGLDVSAGAASIQPSLRRERFDESADRGLLSSAQTVLWNKLSGERSWKTLPKLSEAAVSVLREFEADEAAREDARTSLRTLTRRITASETAESESAAKAREATRQLNEVSRQAEKLKRDVEARNATVESLRGELKELRGTLDARGKTHQENRLEISKLQERLAGEGRRIEELRGELATRESQGSEGRTELSELRGRYAEQSERLAVEIRRLDELSKELSGREAQWADGQAALGELRGRYAEQGERLAAEGRRVEALRGELAAREAKAAEAQAALNERLAAEGRRAEALRGELAAREAKAAEAQAALNERLAAEGRRVEELRGELATRESDVSALQTALDVAEGNHAKTQSELTSITSALESLQGQYAEQNERFADATLELESERRRREALEAKSERQHAKAQKQRARSAWLKANVHELTESKDEIEARLGAIEASRSWRVVSTIGRWRQRLAFSNRAARGQQQADTTAEAPPSRNSDDESLRDDHAPDAATVSIGESVSKAAPDAAALVRMPSSGPTGPASAAVHSGRTAQVATRSVSGKLPITALVITWDIGHNPVGRSYMLAEVIDRVVRHTVIAGFQFPRYGNSLWEPLRNSRIPVIRIPGKSFPDFLDSIDRIARVARPDIVIACKPRLPSFQLGLRIKEEIGCPLILDIDDHELSFFKDRTPLSLAELECLAPGSLKDGVEPYGQTWTRLTESLVGAADARLVSNTALRERFGGFLVPHVRDETRFNWSAAADRSAIRSRFGIPMDSKVVLFFGTPRTHKGIGTLAEAVSRIGDPAFRLVIVGTAPDRSVTAMLDQKAPGQVIQVPNQPFSAIPEVLACADAVALPQDVDHAVSQYQLPAKAIDAVAMGVPLLVSRTPPLMDLVHDGVATVIEEKELPEELERAVQKGMSREHLDARRARFLETYSYAAAARQMRGVIERALDSAPGVAEPGLGARLANTQRQLLGFSFAGRPRDDVGHDVVLFWKQNDTTLYGRRHDMIIKYLASRPDTRRILVFDAPISIHKLLQSRGAPDDRTQHRHVYVRTEEKLLGLRDEGKIRYRVFAFQPGVYSYDASQPGKPALAAAYMDFLRETLDADGIRADRSVFWFYPKNELIAQIVKTFSPRRTVVDVVDDHRAWPNISELEKERLTEHYREVLSLADMAFANCQSVCDSMHEFFPGIQLIPNGYDPDPPVADPDDSPEFNKLKAWPGKVIGFVGNLESKIDIDLLHRVAEAFPECLLVLAGSTHANPRVVELDRHSNVLMPGVVPHEFAGSWIRRFDVAIIPHLKTDLTDNMNPLKLFVYASHHVPVVSTDVPNLDERLESLSIARSPEEFVAGIRTVLADPPRSTVSARYKATNSWQARFQDVVDALFEDQRSEIARIAQQRIAQ